MDYPRSCFNARLRQFQRDVVPHPESPLDKQIAAIALLYDLILVTRNIKHFVSTGVKVLDPFAR